MKNLGIAVGVALAIGLVLFGIAALVMPSHITVAEVIGGLPFLGTHNLSAALERRETRSRIVAEIEHSIPTYQQFAIDWRLLAAYGALMIFGLSQLCVFVADLLTRLFGGDPNSGAAIFASAVPIAIAGGYLIGRWIGTRSAERGPYAVMLAAFLGCFGTRVVEFIMLSPENFAEFYGSDKGFGLFLGQLIGGTVVYSACGLVGYWRGRRMRFTQYLRYLLSVLPKDTRDVLVKMAYEEAQRLGQRRPQAAH